VKSFCVSTKESLNRVGIGCAKINKLKINQRVKNLRGELMFYIIKQYYGERSNASSADELHNRWQGALVSSHHPIKTGQAHACPALS
jgi:hypothetical protein